MRRATKNSREHNRCIPGGARSSDAGGASLLNNREATEETIARLKENDRVDMQELHPLCRR